MIRKIQTIDTHTVGQPTRIVIDTLPEVPGRTMIDKKNYIQENYDYIRKVLMNEPRGHKEMFGAFLLNPADEEADIGLVFMDSGGYLNMCGHGTIGTVTMCIRKGYIKKKDVVKVDTPSGLITCRVTYKDGDVENVSFENVPSYMFKKSHVVQLDDKEVEVDIAYGGSFFGLVKAEDLGLSVSLDHLPELLKYATVIQQKLNNEILVSHPENPEIKKIDLIEFTEKVSDNHYKNVVVFGNNQVDRSPCGTGTCAKLAVLNLEPGKEITNESILGTTFKGKVISKAQVGNFEGIVAEITGSAWITGTHTYVLEDNDYYQEGFVL